jgi:hypothetical protein
MFAARRHLRLEIPEICVGLKEQLGHDGFF